MTDGIPMEKPQLMRAVLSVKEKRFLTPHYIRIVLQGEVKRFAAARIGDNNKIIVPADKHTQVVLSMPGPGSSEDASSFVRTYTMRNIDLEKELMTIDFVAHGEGSPASRWAINAEAGDQLGVLMKVKVKPLFLPAAWYVLAGDHTALPVISVILESLPERARGVAVLEVYSPDDVLELKKPEGIEIIWKFNDRPGKASTLVPYFEALSLPVAEDVFVFAAAEYHAVSEIQQVLREVPGLPRQQWQAYSYWKYGQAEDAR